MRRDEKRPEELHVLLPLFQTRLLVNSIEKLVWLFWAPALSGSDCHQSPSRLGLFVWEEGIKCIGISAVFCWFVQNVGHEDLEQRVASTIHSTTSLS